MAERSPRDELTRIGEATGRPIYRDDSRGTYHLWFDDREYEPVSTAVLFGVSSVRGVSPESLETLSDRIDPEALNALFRDGKPQNPTTRSVSFQFANCSVTVYGDGEIVIESQ